MSKTIWKEVPIFEEKRDSYTDGLENVGDVSRKREKSKEPKRLDFVSASKDDAIGHSHHISQSLRTKKSDKLLNMAPPYDEYSKNQKLTVYKEALLSSGSVDHVVPFNHSEGIRGKEFKELRPSHGKLYPKSAKLMVINAKKEKKENEMLTFRENQAAEAYDAFDSK